MTPMKPLSPEEELEIENATSCTICTKSFESSDKKVRDHCHITGNKRFGAAHWKCNLNYKDTNFIPIIFHNLTGYDYHLFIKQLCSHGYVNKKGELRKKYLQMRFIDSLKFLPGSLQNLADNLSEEHFLETKKYFTNPSTFSLMRQKADFYDQLNREHISDEDFKRVKTVWKTFNCQNLGQYSDIYLKTDVLL